MSTRARRRALALAAALAVWLGQPRVAPGHAVVLESLPRPDGSAPSSLSRVALRFNSRIEKALCRLSLLGPDGRRVALRADADGAPDRLIAPLPALAPGTYTLEWKVLSADGHVTTGGFRFRVTGAN